MNPTSFIESKAIALPCEVQESLLCLTSDAREVVRQLQETLQPDQVSLQAPGLETRQLIRCLARTAKDSNRLDVFEHLREITPAGTCGEFGTLAKYNVIDYCSFLSMVVCILNCCWQ